MMRSALCFGLGALLLTPVVGAHQKHAKKAAEAPKDEFSDLEDVEEIEELDGDFEELADVEASDEPEQATGLIAVIGYLHPAAVHIPIAWLLLLFLIDAATFLKGREELVTLGYWLLLGTLASMSIAIATGLVRLDAMGLKGELLADAELHRNVQFACMALLSAAGILRWRNKNALSGKAQCIYLGLVALAALTVAVGGHLGGEMLYGDPPF